MAHHASAIKRIRQNAARRLHNRYYAKTARTLIKKLRSTSGKAEAQALYKQAASTVDKLAKKGIIHKNNASNRKSRLARLINKLS